MGFYGLILLFHLPWAILLATALIRMRGGHTGRLYRMQSEGAALSLASMAACWLIYDPNFGVDRHGVAAWSEWFDRGEPGLFWIGILLFMLGYVLERRPRQGLVPWPKAANAVAWLSLIAGSGIGLFGFYNVSLPWIDLPWQPTRMAFTLGCLPFAVCYAVLERRVRHAGDAE